MPTTSQAANPTVAVRVWDLPTRAFHWALVLAVLSLVITAELDALVWHMRIGLGVGALLLFRLVWGVVGGRWSRFASFVRGPASIARYLKGQGQPGDHFEVGHNPLGALSVLALLTLLLLQVASGLVADDEVATTGPLNRFVSSAVASLGTAWHTEVGKLILIVLVLLHVGAIVYYRRKKQVNLVQPMLSATNRCRLAPPPAPTRRPRAGWPPPCWQRVWPWWRGWARWDDPRCRHGGLRLDSASPPLRPAAMDTPEILLRAPRTPDEITATRAMMREYALAMGFDLCFQNFEGELAACRVTTRHLAAACCWPGWTARWPAAVPFARWPAWTTPTPAR